MLLFKFTNLEVAKYSGLSKGKTITKTELPALGQNREWFTATFDGQESVYVTGGASGLVGFRKIYDDVFSLNIRTQKWQKDLPKLRRARCTHSSVLLNQ